MKLSEPITDVEQLTPALLTDRFGRNGFLKSGSVTSIRKNGLIRIIVRGMGQAIADI